MSKIHKNQVPEHPIMFKYNLHNVIWIRLEKYKVYFFENIRYSLRYLLRNICFHFIFTFIFWNFQNFIIFHRWCFFGISNINFEHNVVSRSWQKYFLLIFKIPQKCHLWKIIKFQNVNSRIKYKQTYLKVVKKISNRHSMSLFLLLIVCLGN